MHDYQATLEGKGRAVPIGAQECLAQTLKNVHYGGDFIHQRLKGTGIWQSYDT